MDNSLILRNFSEETKKAPGFPVIESHCVDFKSSLSSVIGPTAVLILFLLTAFKKHVIYEETSAKYHGFHLHIQVQRELEPKVI